MCFGTSGGCITASHTSHLLAQYYLPSARMRSEGYGSRSVCVCVCVCVSVCLRLFSHYRLRGGLLAIPTAAELREPEKQKDDFPETTVFKRYAVKTSEKANMHNSAGLPRPVPLALCTLEAQEVTTKGVYRLPHAIC